MKNQTFIILFSLIIAVAAQQAGSGSGRGSITSQAGVERDSLESMVRYLSILDPESLTLRTRFTGREAELAAVADSLTARLERYTGNAVQRRTFSAIDTKLDSVFAAENIIGFIRGTGASPGRMLVTAHYDATGSRSPGWDTDWTTMPAPGADDNATGVAALMEVARVLDNSELPFDVEFVLFSAEELGLIGSAEYLVGCDSACADTILGVINLDMIGFDASDEYDGTIMSIPPSGWLADLLFLEAIDGDGSDPSLRVLRQGPSNWDHASFWEHDPHITAVTIAEPLEGAGGILYPYYHTVDDTIGNIDFAQVEDLTVYLVDFLSQFAVVPAEMALLPSDLIILIGNYPTARRIFRSGDSITVWIRARSIGGANPDPGSGFTMSVTLENGRGTQTLYTGDFDVPAMLKAREIELPLALDERFAGENIVRASITCYGFDDSPGNNSIEESFGVEAGGEIILSHGFRPNPIATAFKDAFFCVNLASEVNCIVEIYTVEGELVDQAFLGVSYGDPLEAGMNCLRCGDIFRKVDNLASGIYIYRMKLYSLAGDVSQHTGKFAVGN